MNALERLRAVLCEPDGEVVIDGTDADRSIVAEALKELDAALSQTAGVAEPNGKLVGWWNGIMPDVTERSPYGPSVRWGADAEDSAHDIPLYDGYNPIHYRQPDALAAAPTASGGEDGLAAGIMAHFCNAIDNLNDMPVSDEWARKWTAKAEFMIGMGPDPDAVSMSDTGDQLLAAAPTASDGDGEMCPNCVTPWKCNGPHESTGVASVSERARAMVDEVIEAAFGLESAEASRCPGENTDVQKDRLSRARSALEQALTQQRVAAPYDAGMAMHWIERYAAGIDEECQLDRIAEAFTTPQPSADAVREYVTELRAQADQKMGVAGAFAHDGDRARYKSAAQLLRRVADELESLLSAASGEKGVDDTKRLDWIARQGGYEFDFGILNDQPGDGDWFVHGMGGSGQGATFRDAIDAAIKEEAGGQDANTDILDTLAFKTENGDAGRGSVTYIALVASGEADHQQNAAQGGGSHG